jgi:hypothetical protein
MADTSTLPATNGSHAQVAASEADQKALTELQRLQRVADLKAAGWTVDLSGGQTATLCDPADVTERQRRAFKAASVKAKIASRNGDASAADQLVGSDDFLIVTFLRAWSLPHPVANMHATDSLQELPGRDFDRLVHVCNDLVRDAFLDLEVSVEESSPFGASSV